MIYSIFSRTILAYIFGNIYYFIKGLFVKEDVLWKSKFYGRYYAKRILPRGKYLFLYLFGLAIPSGAGIYYMFENEAILRFYGIVMSWMILFMIYFFLFRFFDKITFLKNRIEIRILFYPYKTIPYEKIKLILRDKESKEFLHIIYENENGKIDDLGPLIGFWEIPAEILTKFPLEIDPKIIYSNVLLDYEDVKNTLPPNPLIRPPHIKWQEATIKERLVYTSMYFVNPIIVISLFVIFYGINFVNLYSIILFDFSVKYVNYVLKMTPNEKIDYSLIGLKNPEV
jgi:hypothetical protein